MRAAIVPALALFLSCSSSELESARLKKGEPVRLNGCTLVPSEIYADFVMMESSCEAPEAALKDDQWWGDAAPPRPYSVGPGDCLILRDKFFCLETMDPPLLRATYDMPKHGGVLRKIKESD